MKVARQLLLAIGIPALLNAGCAGNYELADRYYQSGEYDAAFKYYQKAAAQGDAQAENDLGIAYLRGLGTKVNYGKAFYYFNLSANQGVADAVYNLGHCYRYGYGVAKSPEQMI